MKMNVEYKCFIKTLYKHINIKIELYCAEYILPIIKNNNNVLQLYMYQQLSSIKNFSNASLFLQG